MSDPIRIRDVRAILEQLAPESLAEDYDNVGLLVGEADTPVRGILVALDITPEVLEEARDQGANLVISHHPIWFRPRSSLNGNDFVSNQILYAIRNDLCLYACHTNLDNVGAGVNRVIVNRLGLRNVSILEPRPGQHGDSPICDCGSGMIGELPESIPVESFLRLVAEQFEAGCIRYAPSHHTHIQRVAVCGGAGSFLLDVAMAQGADAFMTADVTYHKFFDAMGQILYLDVGHYESEQFTGEILLEYIHRHLPDVSIVRTKTKTNPVRYFVSP
ncbi:MAG: Nif3-like dinuclear metal center hexameric protein [Leptospiraceae bacterium]|nr:Nif3-like dinuclear metal center hexameric protein [Leptospiraceae bacterium]